MNYYERHLGDYAKDTAHLTMLEHGAYSLLLDRYYSTEHGIPADQAHRVARARTKEEREAVDSVLAEFFTLADGVWTKGRVEQEIAKAQTKIKAAQRNGVLGGRPKANQTETQQKPNGLFVGSETETQSKALQTPDTRHQTPKEERDSGSVQARTPPPAFIGDENISEIPGRAIVALDPRWELPEAWGLDAEALGWKPPEIIREAEKFRQHWVAGKGAGTRRGIKGWRSSWSNWLANAEKFNIRRVA